MLSIVNKDSQTEDLSRSTAPSQPGPILEVHNNVLNFNELMQRADGRYDIYANGNVVGRLIKRDSEVIISITNDNDLNLTGSANLSRLRIKSKANVCFDGSSLQIDNVLVESEKKVVITQPLTVKNQLELTANTVHCGSEVVANKIKLTANEECANFQLMQADKIKVTAKLFKQEGHCAAKTKLKLHCKHFQSSKNSITKSGDSFKFLGEQIDSEGKFSAVGLAFFSSQNINVSEQFTLPPQTYLHAASVRLKEGAAFKLLSNNEQSTVCIDKDVIIEKGAHFETEKSEITVPTVKNAGEFSIRGSKVQASQLSNQGIASIAASEMLVKYKVTGDIGAKFSIDQSQLVTKLIDVKVSGSFSATQSVVEADAATLLSDTTLSHTKWVSDYLHQGGSSAYHCSQVMFNRQFKLLQPGTLEANTVMMTGANVNCDGKIKLSKHSSVTSNNVEVTGSVDLNESGIKTDRLVGTKKARFHSSHSSPIVAQKLIQIEGESEMNDSIVVSEDMRFGSVTLSNTTVKASKAINFKNVKGEHVTLQAPTVSYSGEHHFQHSTITTTLQSQSGEGSFKDCDIAATFDTIEKQAHAMFDGGHYYGSNLFSSGMLDVKNSKPEVATVSLCHGGISVDNATLNVKESMLAETDSTLTLKNAATLKMKNAVLNGQVNANKALLDVAESLLIEGKNTLDASTVKAGEKLMLDGEHQAVGVNFSGKSVSILGGLSLSAGSLLRATEDMAVASKASIDSKDSFAIAGGKFKIFGEVSAERSKLMANDLAVYHKLKADQSLLKVNESVTFDVFSETQLTKAAVESKNITLSGAFLGQDVSMKAKNNIVVDSTSQMTANGVLLDAAQKIQFAGHSKTTGETLSVRADTIDNSGNINLSKRLSLDANYIWNSSGTMGGTGYTNVTAARAFVNQFGYVTGKETQINALLIANLCGVVKGQDSLTQNSLTSINLGINRSFSFTNNTLLDLNAGLFVPCMPSGLGALSSGHLISACTNFLTHMIPGQARLINFASIAFNGLKMVYNVGASAYSIHATENKSYRELLPNLINPTWLKNARIVDYISPLLAAKGTYVAGQQLFQSSANLTSLDYSFNNTEIKCDLASLPGIVGAAVSSLGPSYTANSLASGNIGLIASHNMTHNSFVGVNSGIDVATGSAIFNTSHVENVGVVAGNHVMMTGDQFRNRGIVANHSSMNLSFAEITNEAYGAIFGVHADIHAQTLRNEAEMRFKESKVSVEKLSNTGEYAQSGSVLQTNEIHNQGDMTSFSSLTQVNGVVANDGKMTQSASVLKATSMQNTGNYTANQSSTMIENMVDNAGQITQNESALKAASMQNTGDYTANQSSTMIENKVDNAGQITQNESVLKAASMQNAGDYTANQSSTEIANNIDSAGRITQNESALKAASMQNTGDYTANQSSTMIENKVDNAGQITQNESALKAASMHNAGDYTTNQSSTMIESNVDNAGQIIQNESALKAASMQNTGDYTANQSSTEIANNIDSAGRITQNESVLKAASMQNAGDYTANQSSTHIENNIGNAGQITQNESALKAALMQNTGDYTANQSSTEIANNIDSAGRITQNESVLKAASMQNAGDYTANQSSTEITNQIGNAGQITQNESVLKAASMQNAGDYTANQSSTMIESNVDNAGQIIQNESALKAASMQNAGDYTANQSSTHIENNIGNAGQITQNESALKAASMQNTGSYASDKSSTEITNQIDNDGKMVIRESLLSTENMNNSGDYMASQSATEVTNEFANQGHTIINESSLLNAKKIVNENSLAIDSSKLTASDELRNKGLLTANESVTDAGRLLNEGQQVFSNAEINVASEFVQAESGSTKTDTVLIKAKSLELDGKYQTSDTLFEASDVATVKSTASFAIDHNTQIAARDISFNATAENNDTFALSAAGNLVVSASANIAGDAGKFYANAKHGEIDGTINQQHIGLEIDHLKNAVQIATGNGAGKNISASEQFSLKTEEALNLDMANQREGSVSITAADIKVTAKQHIASDYRLEATVGHVTVNADVSAGNDLVMKAKENITNNQKNITAGQDAVLYAGQSVHNNQGNVVAGRNEDVIAENGEVRNTGGNLQGMNHINVVAKSGIINEAVEHTVKAKHGTKKSYTRASILGGKGEGFDNGAAVITDGKLTNDASTIAASGALLASGKEGIDLLARVHEELVHKSSKRSGFLKHKKTKRKEYDTHVEESTMASSQSSTTMVTDSGEVFGEAANIASATGTTIVAEKSVRLYDIVAHHEVEKKKSGLCGLTHSHKRSKDDYSVPTQLYSAGDRGITVISVKDDIYFRGTSVRTPGKFYAEAEDITFTVSKLKHEYRQDSFGMGISTFGQTITSSHAPKQRASLPFQKGETTLNHVDRLVHSNGAAEAALNTASTGVAVANTTNRIVQGVRNGDLLQEGLNHFGVGSINPDITATFNKHSEKYSFESLGEGDISVGSAELTARSGNVTLEGLPVDVEGNMKVTANEFIQQGMSLTSKSSQQDSSMGIGFSAQSVLNPNISASHSQRNEQREDHVNQQLHVGANLELNVRTWRQDGANADVDSLSGHADKHVITTHLNSYHATSSSGACATSGHVSASAQTTDAKYISETAGVNIRGENASSAGFTVGTLESTGGVIQGSGAASYHADNVIAHDVKESIKSTGFSISGNIKDVMPENKTSHAIQASDDQGQVIKTVDLSLAQEDYRATQHATAAFKEGASFSANQADGYLATNAADSKEVRKDESHHYVAEVPIYDNKAIDQMRDNARWVESKATGEPYQPHRPISEAILAHEKLNTPEEVAAYVEKIKQMDALSVAVYGNGPLPEGYHPVDTGYGDVVTDSKVVAYVNQKTGELVFAFKGTDSVTNLVVDDRDIAMGRAPRSFDEQMLSYIKTTIENYPGYHVSFTGHSLGAAEASLASSYFDQNAYVFDNPGIYDPTGQYDFSNVTSFQGSGNIVNNAGPLTGRDFDQGNVIQLAATNTQRLISEGAKQFGAGGALLRTTYGHSLSEVHRQLESYLNNQLAKARQYPSQGSSTFFHHANAASQSDQTAKQAHRF